MNASGSRFAKSKPEPSAVSSSACGAICLPIRETAIAEPNIDALSTALTTRRGYVPRRQIIHTAKQISNATQ